MLPSQVPSFRCAPGGVSVTRVTLGLAPCSFLGCISFPFPAMPLVRGAHQVGAEVAIFALTPLSSQDE